MAKTHLDKDTDRGTKWTLDRGKADSLREKAKELSNSNARASFELGKILYEIYYSDVLVSGKPIPIWKVWGHDSWFNYVECELHMHVHTANSYRNVYDVFGVSLKGSFNPDDLLPITKMRALSRIVTKQNLKSWLKKAGQLSCCQLEDEIEIELTGNRKKTKHFSVLMTKSQFDDVKEIILKAKEIFGDIDNGDVVARVFNQWDKQNPKRKLRVVGGKNIRKMRPKNVKKAA
jgi:hypothetical protein